MGAFPTVLWTVCFKQVKRIPDSFRPPVSRDISLFSLDSGVEANHQVV